MHFIKREKYKVASRDGGKGLENYKKKKRQLASPAERRAKRRPSVLTRTTTTCTVTCSGRWMGALKCMARETRR